MATKREKIRRVNRVMVPTQELARHFIRTPKRRRARFMCKVNDDKRHNDGTPHRNIIIMRNIMYESYWMYMADEPDLEKKLLADKRFKKLFRKKLFHK